MCCMHSGGGENVHDTTGLVAVCELHRTLKGHKGRVAAKCAAGWPLEVPAPATEITKTSQLSYTTLGGINERSHEVLLPYA